MHQRICLPVCPFTVLRVRWFLFLTLLLLLGCSLIPPSPTPTPVPTPTQLPSPTPWPSPTPRPTPRPTLTPEPPDTGWQLLETGVELRQLNVETGEVAERLTIVRLDPAVVRFRIHYDPLTPLPVTAWAGVLQSPMVINGGYFTPEYKTAALLISGGRVYGTPYGDFAGMFAVTADEQVSVRWLRHQPYNPNEYLREGLQSFPVLIKPGIGMGFPADADDGRPARRTVVAQDSQGRVLFIVAPHGYLSLHELAQFLADSDLDLHVALNLDGGTSTGLWLKTRAGTVEIASLTSVPSVISVDYR
jgi:uncharacterized protein YigE (DUF2233 family)